VTETRVYVQKACGNEHANLSNIFRWYSRSRDGRELVEDDEIGDRPNSTRNEVNIAVVADMVQKHRRIASRMIEESLNFPKTVVILILKEDCERERSTLELIYTFIQYCFFSCLFSSNTCR
jgi:hypothetical protein